MSFYLILFFTVFMLPFTVFSAYAEDKKPDILDHIINLDNTPEIKAIEKHGDIIILRDDKKVENKQQPKK